MQDNNLSSFDNNNFDKESFDFSQFIKKIATKKKFLISFFILLFSTLLTQRILSKRANPEFKGSFSVLISEPFSKGSALTKGAISLNAGTSTNIKKLATVNAYLKSDFILGDLARKYNLSTSELASKISIDQGGEGADAKGVLAVTLTTYDPNYGEILLNDLSKTFLNASIELKKQKITNGLDYINAERPKLDKSVDEYISKLGNYRDKYSIVKKGKVIVNLIRKDDYLKRRIKFLEENNSKNNILLTNPQNNSEKLINEIAYNVEKINNFKIKLKEIDKEFSDQPLLLKTIRSIDESLAREKLQLKLLDSSEDEYLMQVARKDFEWTMISPPIMNINKVGPVSNKIIIVYLFLSALSSFIVGYAIILFDNKFILNEEIITYSKLPILAELKYLKDLPDTPNNIIEKLKNSIDYFNNNEENFLFKLESFSKSLLNFNANNFQSFLIASSNRREGRSFINLLSAYSLSKLNEKILIIEANNQKSYLKELFEIDKKIGLFDYLSSDKLDYENYLNKTKLSNKIDLIHSGDPISGASILLASEKMHDLISKLKSKYKFIFFDVPASLDSTESNMLANLADGIFLLINKKTTVKDKFKKLHKTFLNNKSAILGLIINS